MLMIDIVTAGLLWLCAIIVLYVFLRRATTCRRTTLYERMMKYNPDLTGKKYQELIGALKTERDRVYGTTIITEEDK